jgi:3-oxoacyl-[acyl-carrier protein] reductase
MNLDLTGFNALVTGASQGIGRAIAVALAGQGANITLLARNAEVLAQVLSSLPRKEGQDHDFLVADLSNIEELHKKVSLLAASRAYQILINNSGGPAAGPAHSAAVSAYEAAWTQHLLASHTLVQALLPGMRSSAYGRIINILSTSVKAPLDNLGVSNTIRGAVANWAKTLANELGPEGITVNNVLPGFTLTTRLEDIIHISSEKSQRPPADVIASMQKEVPLRRFATPAEIANAAAFLASPAASYITGINLPVDGGRTKNL